MAQPVPPSVEYPISVKMPADLLRKIDELAAHDPEATRSSVIRQLLRKVLAERPARSKSRIRASA